jgi:putative ABC transport system permease protein
MNTLWQDLRYGARMLFKSRGFTVVAVVTLALGIGANTAIFSVVNAVLFRPLPYDDPHQLVMVWQTNQEALRQLGMTRIPVTYADFYDWRDQNKVFEALAALDPRQFNLSGQGEPERLNGVRATPNLFSLLRVKPVIGRDFLPEEEREGAANVAILSYAFWQRRFAGDEKIVGQSLRLNDASYTIVGVLPRSFRFTESSNLPGLARFGAGTDVWTPMRLTGALRSNRGNHNVTVVARLKSVVGPGQAQAEMQTIARRIAQGFSRKPEDFGAEVVPLREQIAGDIRPALLTLLGAVALALLISCANVASLLLARAAARRKELAVRIALGASRSRIIRQMLTESLLLALTGGGVGALLALWGADLIFRLVPDSVSRIGEIPIDYRVLGFTLLISLATGVGFGLAPALLSAKPDVNKSLKEDGLTVIDPRRRAHNLLVVGEIALALTLLVGAGLLIKSFARLTQVNPGFNPANVVSVEISLPSARYRDQNQRVEFFRQALERIKALPDVQIAGSNYALPLSGADPSNSFAIEGRPFPEGEWKSANFGAISPDYFRTLEIPLLRGRYFTDQDGPEAQGVAIIDEEMSRRFFPGEDPIGKMISVGSRDWLTVVGVVGSVKHTALEDEQRPYIYSPYAQRTFYWPFSSIAIRSKTGDVGSLVSAVRREIRAIDKDQPVSNVTTLEELYSKSVAPRRFSMQLLGVFAGLAMLLAVVGLYGVMSYSVTQRVQEIGVRMALGARPVDALRLILGRGIALTLIGIGVGLATALALTRLMSKLLFGVSATDPSTFAFVALLLVGVALLACYLPARRATKVDPMIALRCE